MAAVKCFRATTFLTLSLMLGLIVGCGSTKKATRAEKSTPVKETRQSQTAGQAVLNEDFDPMTLKAPEFRIPSRQVVQKKETLNLATPSVAADTSWQTVPGYQVQLLQTEDAKLARETAREAIVTLVTEVEITYEAPYYKVRAGRFTNRYDAEQLQNLATEKGYVNCWVVRTQVKVRANELLDQK
ncbi:MAG: SPOR domain-containing protein [candidate division KSB1 bacterium]|nr:SPOR domain-containing protein [candidate division KSB1 bacterium]MDZ7303087.1 SPOR domain-containing protein [candidate division KSB1 bacterium]MDZ7312626.1 SPOR domain-containing protein [candidate division KSB1 bacterium]